MIGFKIHINNKEPIMMASDSIISVILRYGCSSGAIISLIGRDCPNDLTWLKGKPEIGGMLEVGDVIEVEVAEFDEASMPVADEKHSSLMKKMSERVEDYSKDLEFYYRLKKVLEDENLI